LGEQLPILFEGPLLEKLFLKKATIEADDLTLQEALIIRDQLSKANMPTHVTFCIWRHFHKRKVMVCVPAGVGILCAPLVLGNDDLPFVRWLGKTCGKPRMEDYNGKKVLSWVFHGYWHMEFRHYDLVIHFGDDEYVFPDSPKWNSRPADVKIYERSLYLKKSLPQSVTTAAPITPMP
jgi:hypothetical protein